MEHQAQMFEKVGYAQVSLIAPIFGVSLKRRPLKRRP